MGRHNLVLVRGPSGSGKTVLCRAWAGRPPYAFELLSTDEVQGQVDRPGLPDDDAFEIVLDRVGEEIARRIARGPLLVDAGLRDAEHFDRVLSPSARKRCDPDVVLIRLTVDVDEAVRRKRDLPAARVRELHEKWQTRPVEGETVLNTDGLSETAVSRGLEQILANRIGPLQGFRARD